jgi:sporulation protein YlmC with PRC-barrel domain
MQTNTAADLGTRETSKLIASDKVEGTPVYRSSGEQIGQIERVMIDKLSGKVACAVMSFGGFLGMGEDHYPVPWSVLTYNERLGGYEVNVTDAELRGAPKYSRGTDYEWNRTRDEEIHAYYNRPGYWF